MKSTKNTKNTKNEAKLNQFERKLRKDEKSEATVKKYLRDARSRTARAAARARGYEAVDMAHIPERFDAVVNTVPAPVLQGDYGGALCLDLASDPGGWATDAPVLKAPGLPGLYAPRAAANVMAEAIYRVMEEDATHG